MIVIVDYGAGNIRSVKNALDYLGVRSRASSNPREIEQADRLIFPGVGSFGYLMGSLKKGIGRAIMRFIASGKPFLGICLGLQALFESSEESAGVAGLGILRGRVVRFSRGKVPHVGWNIVKPRKPGIIRAGYMYFVNSYYVIPEDESVVAATTDYYSEFVSAISYKNILAVQFHPEKSGDSGIEFLRRWLRC